MDFLEGFIIRTLLLELYLFLTRFLLFRLISHLRKLNPSFSRLIILDFFSETCRPRSDRKEITRGICSSTSLSLQGLVTIKSSAYLINQLPLIFLPSLLLGEGKPSRTAFSNPFRAILHNNGEKIPSYRVPSLGKVLIPFSMIGAFNHFIIYSRLLRHAIPFISFTKKSWDTLSKHFSMSTS